MELGIGRCLQASVHLRRILRSLSSWLGLLFGLGFFGIDLREIDRVGGKAEVRKANIRISYSNICFSYLILMLLFGVVIGEVVIGRRNCELALS